MNQLPRQDFVHADKTLKFWALRGPVLSTHKHSETHVTSSGGSAQVHHTGTTQVTAPTVSSHVVTKQEFWIRAEPDGRDVAFKLSGKDVPLRAGQVVTVIQAGYKPEAAADAVLVNHNAAKHWFLADGRDLNARFGLDRPGRWRWVLLAVVAGGLVWYYMAHILGVAAFVAPLVYAYKVNKRMRRVEAALQAHLDALAQQEYSASRPLLARHAPAAEPHPA